MDSGFIDFFVSTNSGYNKTAKFRRDMRITNAGVNVFGKLTATSKNFEIDHPTKSNKTLTHSCLEGPEAGVYYRGEAQLKDGAITIVLPEYFEALTHKEDRTVLLTARADTQQEAINSSGVVPTYVKDGKFDVFATDKINPSQRFWWEVKAVRKDIPKIVVESEKIEEE